MKTQIVKIKHLAVMTGIALAGVGSSAMTPVNALTFNFTPTAMTSQQARDGFVTAGNFWSLLFTDNVTININIDYLELAPNVLGEAGSSSNFYSYQSVYNALASDATTADDASAVGSLSNSSTFKTSINHTTDNPNGNGSLIAYAYNGSQVEVNNANAKALGLISNNNNVDASISFSTLFTWDFDRSDGISTGAFDFVGVAAHEIGHALGFVSGVDYIDGTVDTAFNSSKIAALDLFRYSTTSSALSAIDITAGTRDKYFSLDKGVTKIASFSTGAVLGDKSQASHWKDSSDFRITPELGIMNPTFSNGQLGIITENDLRAFDVIGWNRASATATAVPEPADFVGTAIGAIFGFKLIQKRRQQQAKSTTKAI